jgi:(p)ppGpp synthase/HD superfamily hydrolase
MLEKAVEIAISAHKNQRDKSGKPYIGHLLRVMQAGKTEDEQICGVLHDLVEDSDWTFENLKKEGFPDHIIDALKCLTKQANEIYDHFIDRVMTNTLAVQVKINDLTDNMDIKRLTSIGEKDVERLNTYLKAYRKLKS